MDYQKIIDKYYPAGTLLRDIYMRHCRAVAGEAVSIARRNGLRLDESRIEAAAMLHDIGIFATDAPSIQCHGTQPYIRHGIIGRDLLIEESCPEDIAEVAARHTGAGLTEDDIRSQNLLLPAGDYCPRTMLEKLVCYADKFYSKSGDMKRKPFDRVRASIARFGSASLERFDAMAAIFGKE